MKTLGIVGGIGPESTIIYYRSIIREYRRHASGSNPSILINSIDNDKLLRLVRLGKLGELIEYLVYELQSLVRAGATTALLAANTPHLVFNEVQQRSSISLISVVEATGDAAKSLGLKRLGLFGTSFTMNGRFYPDVLEKRSIEIVQPSEAEQEYIHDKYIAELLTGILLPQTRDELLRIAGALKDRDHIDGLILGGTELSLLFPVGADIVPPVPFLDTTDIHAKAAAAELVKNRME